MVGSLRPAVICALCKAYISAGAFATSSSHCCSLHARLTMAWQQWLQCMDIYINDATGRALNGTGYQQGLHASISIIGIWWIYIYRKTPQEQPQITVRGVIQAGACTWILQVTYDNNNNYKPGVTHWLGSSTLDKSIYIFIYIPVIEHTWNSAVLIHS